MQITNEEMEALNRASEILSKYAEQGNLSQDDFDHFERMVIAIIDGIREDDSLDVQSNNSNMIDQDEGQLFPTSKYRIDESLLQRDLILEEAYGIEELKLYGYYSDTNSLYIVGQVVAQSLKKPLCMICSLYDKDGDIIETTESSSYGSGIVTSMIKPDVFFSGFPFKFLFWSVPMKRIKRISITPADSY